MRDVKQDAHKQQFQMLIRPLEKDATRVKLVKQLLMPRQRVSIAREVASSRIPRQRSTVANPATRANTSGRGLRQHVRDVKQDAPKQQFQTFTRPLEKDATHAYQEKQPSVPVCLLVRIALWVKQLSIAARQNAKTASKGSIQWRLVQNAKNAKAVKLNHSQVKNRA